MGGTGCRGDWSSEKLNQSLSTLPGWRDDLPVRVDHPAVTSMLPFLKLERCGHDRIEAHLAAGMTARPGSRSSRAGALLTRPIKDVASHDVHGACGQQLLRDPGGRSPRPMRVLPVTPRTPRPRPA